MNQHNPQMNPYSHQTGQYYRAFPNRSIEPLAKERLRFLNTDERREDFKAFLAEWDLGEDA